MKCHSIDRGTLPSPPLLVLEPPPPPLGFFHRCTSVPLLCSYKAHKNYKCCMEHDRAATEGQQLFSVSTAISKLKQSFTAFRLFHEVHAGLVSNTNVRSMLQITTSPGRKTNCLHYKAKFYSLLCKAWRHHHLHGQL